MAIPVIMPRQGQSVESCIITKWHKKKGDKVQAGEILFSYETDKASFDEEAKVEGVLLEVFFQEGDEVPCLSNVCVIGNEGESADEFNPNIQKVAGEVSEPETQQVQTERKEADFAGDSPSETWSAGDRVKISPRARNLAERLNVDYRYAEPTGPHGRIVEKDIVTLKESGYAMTPAALDESLKSGLVRLPRGTGLGGRITAGDLKNSISAASGEQTVGGEYSEYEEVKISNIRKVIAKTMLYSISSTCQLTLHTSFDATDIIEFRKRLKESRNRFEVENITINDIILYAVSRTLPNHRDLNAHFLDDRMVYFKNVNLGVAVDTERGLMVPTIFNANLKSLNDISKEVKKLVKDCQSGAVSPDMLKGGSFTVTNLGTLGIECFTPVLNPPQTGILGVNAIIQRVKEVDGKLVSYPSMGLSLTFDHRALDGAPAARFLQELKNNLENFSIMLVK